MTGPYADEHTALLGDYVAPLAPHEQVSVRDALAARVDVVDVLETGPVDAAVVVVGGTSHRRYDDAFADNGALAAAGAGTRARCGEGVDLADLRLPADQLAALDAARSSTSGPLVAVVVSGRPHVLDDVLARADAVLVAGYPGPYGAPAVVDALLGAFVPSGRLPATWPSGHGSSVVLHDDRYAVDGVYLDLPHPVGLPLGHGRGPGPAPVPRVDVRVEGDAPGEVVVEARPGADGVATPAYPFVLLARRAGGHDRPRGAEVLATGRWPDTPLDTPPDTPLDTPRVATFRTSLAWRLPASAVFAAPWVDAGGRPQGDPATRLWLGTGPTRLDLGTLHPDGRLDPPD